MRSTAFRMLRVSIPLLLGAVAAPVAAQSLPVSAPLPITIAPPDTTKVYRFEIPSQPIAEALADFARQTGLRVELADSTARDARSTAVAGMYTAPSGLRVLLTGTSLVALFVDPETIVVRRTTDGAVAQAMTPVVVSADATRRTRYTTRRTSSATRTDTPLRDTPQAITVVAADLIADQSMQNMADVVRYVPGVSMGQGEGHRDAPTIRGQESTADFYADGMRDDAQYLRDLYNVERVEALKGPNAMIFGRGGGGGVINRVTKEAQWVPTRSLTLEGGSFEHRRAMFDLGDGLGRSAAVRVNAMIEDSRHFRHATELERYGVTPTTTFLLGSFLTKVSYEYFADRRTVNRGIPSFLGAPVRTDIATFFGDPNTSRSRLAMHGGTATVDRAWGGLTLRNRTRLVRYDKFYQNVFGDGVTAGGTEVNLRAYNNSTDRRSVFNQTDVTYTLGTGSVRQTILVGAEVSSQRSDNYRNTGYFNGTTTSMSVPLDAPTVSPSVEYRQGATDANNRVNANVAAVYLQNQIALGPQWQAIVGVRYDHFAVDVHNNRTGENLDRTDELLSPRVGVVFKPGEPVSLYGSYSVSHLPSAGDQFASLTPTTRALEPEGFRNRELGVKWDIRPDLSVHGAWYRLDRTNTVAPDPNSSASVVQTGRQRSTGHEISLAGSISPAWQIAAGYASQKAAIVSRTSAAPPGAIVPLVPRQTLSLWNRIQLVPRLGAGLGVTYQSKMFAAIDNTVTLPGFTRVDAAAFVTLTQTVRAQLNVENALDTRYFPTSHGNNNIAPGAPRTLRLSLTLAP